MSTPMSELVKDPEWQKVRASLEGQWSSRPEWCCQQLRKYLGNTKTTTKNKMRIVQNYLVGTGFRTGKIKHPCITRLRNDISAEFARRAAQKINEFLLSS